MCSLLGMTLLALVASAVTSPLSRSTYGGRLGATWNLTEFGGKGDNATLNTQAFVKAVDAVRTAGGGTLVVPDGVFVTAPFDMTSHMTLFLTGGATIVGPSAKQLGPSPAFPLWPIIAAMPSYGQGRDHPGPRRTSLIHGNNLTDVIVTSDENAWGKIDGNGQPWWDAHKAGHETVTRGHLIEFIHTDGIEISNLNLRNSPFWTVHPVYSRNIVVRNIDIWAPKDSPNTDGVDPESSQNVLIENFRYHGGDDVIAIKSGWDCFGYKYAQPCKNIHIRNVTAVWTRAAGCAIGSEMSGGMENITVTDCDFTNTGNGLNIKYSEYRGGYVKDIHYSNIVMGNIARSALTVDSGYGSKNPSCKNPKKMPCPVSTITYTNITQAAGTECDYLLDFKGLPGSTIQHVQLDGVRLKFKSAVHACDNVEGTFRDAEGAEKCSKLKPDGGDSRRRGPSGRRRKESARGVQATPQACEQTCLKTCCRNGGGQACIDACGCHGKSCDSMTTAKITKIVAEWSKIIHATNGGCAKPGACGLAYQGCCFGAGHSGDACKCKLTDGSGEVGTQCSGMDKAGACGVAYTACCIGYKAKGDPCTCDVESP